jgi:hypothetical protein
MIKEWESNLIEKKLMEDGFVKNNLKYYLKQNK